MFAFFRKFGFALIAIQALALLMGQRAFVEQVTNSGIMDEFPVLEKWHWVAIAAGVMLLFVLAGRLKRRRIASKNPAERCDPEELQVAVKRSILGPDIV